MLKFIVIMLAAFMAVGFIGAVFPSLTSSHITIGSHQVSTYLLSMIGTVFTFYKVVS